MESFKLSFLVPIYLLVAESLIVFAVRKKITYDLYNWFPNALRIHQFLWQRKFNFYWGERSDFSAAKLMRLYVLWTVARFDKYLPLVDCDRQAAKAQYFHDSGRYVGMRGFAFRYVNPKAWPFSLVYGLKSFLFPLLPQ